MHRPDPARLVQRLHSAIECLDKTIDHGLPPMRAKFVNGARTSVIIREAGGNELKLDKRRDDTTELDIDLAADGFHRERFGEYA